MSCISHPLAKYRRNVVHFTFSFLFIAKNSLHSSLWSLSRNRSVVIWRRSQFYVVNHTGFWGFGENMGTLLQILLVLCVYKTLLLNFSEFHANVCFFVWFFFVYFARDPWNLSARYCEEIRHCKVLKHVLGDNDLTATRDVGSRGCENVLWISHLKIDTISTNSLASTNLCWMLPSLTDFKYQYSGQGPFPLVKMKLID